MNTSCSINTVNLGGVSCGKQYSSIKYLSITKKQAIKLLKTGSLNITRNKKKIKISFFLK
jgi:hypothetical protein